MKKQKETKQTITFTKEQFEVLLKTVYMGNWVANAWRNEKYKTEYEKFESYIFSFASQFGLEEYVDHDEEENIYYPSAEFEERTEVHELLDEYNTDTFLDQLAERFGERDFFERYSEEEVKEMTDDDRFKNLSDCICAYHEEIEVFGIDRLRINGKEYDEYN